MQHSNMSDLLMSKISALEKKKIIFLKKVKQVDFFWKQKQFDF